MPNGNHKEIKNKDVKGHWKLPTWLVPSAAQAIHDWMKQLSEVSQESQLLHLDHQMEDIT